MLLEFKVKNFTSFRDETVFSLIASSVSEHPENVIKTDKPFDLVKSSALYGANSSGKSNLFAAMRFMRSFVINSSKESQVGERIAVDPFLLSDETRDAPSSFEMTFVVGGTLYRYGFSVTHTAVVQEWLFYTPKSREIRLFEREKAKKIQIHEHYFKEGRSFANEDSDRLGTRDNALFLSVLASFNGAISSQIINWFRRLRVISGLNDAYLRESLERLRDDGHNVKVISLLKSMGLGIEGLQPSVQKFDEKDLPEEMPETLKSLLVNEGAIKLDVIKKVYDASGREEGVTSWSLNKESEGTKKLIGLTGPIFNVLAEGGVLVIDEFDTRLHPVMARALVTVFHSELTNCIGLIILKDWIAILLRGMQKTDMFISLF